jgi:hypothetical protein
MPWSFRVWLKAAPAQALPGRAVARSRVAAVSWGRRRFKEGGGGLVFRMAGRIARVDQRV